MRAFAVPGDLFEMSKVMFYLHMNGVSPLTLGKCTNVIFPEEGLDIMVISTENLRKLRLGETENTIYAEAGVQSSRSLRATTAFPGLSLQAASPARWAAAF